MKFWIALPVTVCLLLLPLFGSAQEFTGRSHATAMLLLSDSDQSVKLAGKSIFRFGSDDRELLDLLAEVVWLACSEKRPMDADTLSWLAKALGTTKQLRYAGLLDYCLSMKKDEKTAGYLQGAKKALTVTSETPFEGGKVDLAKQRAALSSHRHPVNQEQMIKRFEELRKGTTLAEVYAKLGYPDELGVDSLPAGSAGYMGVRVAVSSAALAVTYKDIGVIRFSYQEPLPDWVLENAVSSTGLFWSKYDGRFIAVNEQIAHGNGPQLREVAEYLLANKALLDKASASIFQRINTTPDSQDWALVDGLVWLGKAVLESGDAEKKMKLTMYLIAHGNGPQLRGVAEHLMDKKLIEREVLDAAMERVSSSRDTQDGYLADGLAWLCKVVQKSGISSYKAALIEISKTAAHKTLRKYADKAADGLG